VQWLHCAPGGAQTSTHLIPAILDLLAQAQLQLTDLTAIVFGAGPGSFTGLRTACSVAQGLAYGAKLPVLPFDTLLAVAETARSQLGIDTRFEVTALLDARMQEIYTASYIYESGLWTLIKPCRLIRPEQLAHAQCLAGNALAIYADRLPQATQQVMALPEAAAMLRLAPALLARGAGLPAAQALPNYVRDKVAQTTLERAQNALSTIKMPVKQDATRCF
jgi:tRNA threonylcarbamoyladenosine biosynthesis protein TsaB